MQVGGTLRPDALKGRIDLENVSFRYPTRPETTVLDNFSLKISPGEVIALVGPSGSGKSSIIKLIERLYDPEKASSRWMESRSATTTGGGWPERWPW